MIRYLMLGCAALGFLAMLPSPQAHAAACANGVYRAGCAGPNGAAVVKKQPYANTNHGTVNCASGPYRAGCAGSMGQR